MAGGYINANKRVFLSCSCACCVVLLVKRMDEICWGVRECGGSGGAIESRETLG